MMCLPLAGTALHPRNKELSPLLEEKLHELMDYLRRGVDGTPIEMLEEILEHGVIYLHKCKYIDEDDVPCRFT
jgi:hypothetical protein